MNQSVIVKDETLAVIIAKGEESLGRELMSMEKAWVEFAVEQIRLGLV